MATTTTFIWVAAGTAGCTHEIDLLPTDGGGGGAAGGAGTGTGGAGGSVITRECAGNLGAPIRFPTSTGSACTSTLGVRGHRFGLCTCDSLDLSASLHADSITSTPDVPLINGASAVGTNGPLSLSSSTADIRTGGSLVVANGVVTAGHIEVGRSLKVAGSMIILDTDVHVSGDAYVGAAISGTLRIDGLLHQTSGAGMIPMLIPETSIRRETISVPPPCDCSSSFVDLLGAVADGVARNDNAISDPPFDPDSLKSVPGGTFTTTCGVYLVNSADISDLFIVHAYGRSELVVKGDMVLRGGLVVLLEDGAEFDLLIGGRLVASGGNSISTNSPARFRIWIAGTESVVLDDAPVVAAQMHVPRAAVVASSGLEIQGGLLARSISAGGPVDVHLDQAVFSSGSSCGEPTATPVQ